jgi:ketopantoate reductase
MRDLIIVGLGELGQLYGASALRAGLRVTPVTRHTSLEGAVEQLGRDVPILVAVGEADLDGVLAALPPARRDAVILLQNELFPERWERHDLTPTVMVPWILKKRGQPLLVARSTPVYGRFAELVRALHEVAGFEAEVLPTRAALEQALVDKYAFILTVNALGLLRDLPLEAWLAQDPANVRELALEAAQLGAALCGGAPNPQQSLLAVERGMRAMGAMRARGRSAGERVQRAVANARKLGIATPLLAQAATTQGA